jgi:glycogen synthase kinase 3 beta
LVEIIKVLGTPSREELMAMNPNYTEFKFPQIKPHPWTKIFRSKTSPEAVDYISKLLVYDPKLRPSGLTAAMHNYFDEIRQQDTVIRKDKPLPDHLFDFSKEELAIMDDATKTKLMPEWYKGADGTEPRA